MTSKHDARWCWRREFGRKATKWLAEHDFRGAWRLSKIIERSALVSPRGLVRCTTDYGFEIVLRPRDDTGVELAIFRSGTYEPGTLEVIRHALSAGDTFLDIGANVGLMSLFAAKIVGASGSCHAFEPVPELYDMLELSRTYNNFTQLAVHRFALGAKIEDRQIFEHAEVNRGSSSLMNWSNDSKGQTVGVRTLDDFVGEALGRRRISFAKIDVEGWELEVLKGGRQVLSNAESPGLCVEYSTLHPLQGGSHADLYDLLISYGYDIFKLKHGKGAKSRLTPILTQAQLPEHDNLFCFKAAQLSKLNQELFFQQ